MDEQSDLQGGLARLRLQYHAKNEGKTILDGFFGRQAGAVARYERSGRDRRDLDDLFNVYATLDTSHVFIVSIDRKGEGVFYRTADGISALHSIEITSQGIQGQTDSGSEMHKVDLGKVKPRQTKTAKETQLRKQADAQQHLAVSVESCQKCQHLVKKGENLEEWLQCEACDRSWHKTCVGIAASTPIDEVRFTKCANCGGTDPVGESLVKRRKIPSCSFCSKPKKGHDHSQCKALMVDAADSFRTPICKVVRQETNRIAYVPFKEPQKVRAGRKGRRKRKGRGVLISESEYVERKGKL